MTRMFRIGLVAIALLAPNELSAHTREAPWCAVIGMGEDAVYWDCQYSSFEECYPNILAGNRGFCNPNPAYQGVERPLRRRHPARHHHVRQ